MALVNLHPEPVIDDEKYTVFKTDELMQFVMELLQQDDMSTPELVTSYERKRNFAKSQLGALRLSDAVVIRHSDVFAAEALYSYAYSIRATLNVLREFGVTDDKMAHLAALADYFAEQAEDAENASTKVPD